MVDKLDVDRALARAVRVAACVVTKAAGAAPLTDVMNPGPEAWSIQSKDTSFIGHRIIRDLSAPIRSPGSSTATFRTLL